MKKVLYISVVTIVLLTIGWFIFKKDKKLESLKEIKPQRDTIIISFRINGFVSPRNRIEIKSQIAGRIEDILVQEEQKVSKGEIVAWLSSTERAALLDIAKSKGEEEYKKWQEIYKPTPIIAPLDGFIIVRDKEPGQTVSANEAILVMADELIIRANVDETDLPNIKLGQRVKFFLDAFPEKQFNGIVEHIAYESQVISNVTVYEIRIKPIFPTSSVTKVSQVERQEQFRRFDRSRVARYSNANSSGEVQTKKEFFRKWIHTQPSMSKSGIVLPQEFRSGMSATVEITLNKKENILTLPVSAIIDKGKTKYVMVKSKNKKSLEQKEVVTGISDGKKVEIISGLTEDDIVVFSEKTISFDSGGTFSGRPGIGSIFGISSQRTRSRSR